MKQRTFWARAAMTLLFAVLGSIGAWAQNETTSEPAIVIWLNDGSSQQVLFDEMPVFTFDNGVVTLKGEETEQSWPLENLNKLTFTSINAFKKGDVNKDGKVDEADIQEINNYIFGNPSANIQKSDVDINGDDFVNVADIVETVKEKEYLGQSIVAGTQNEQVGNDLVIKNGAGTVVERVSATESTEIKFDAKGNKLSIKQGGETKDISLDQVKTITTAPAFRLVSQDKFVYTSTAPITLHFKLTVNDQGEMKPVSSAAVTVSANKGKLASTTVTTNDNGVATVVYTPEPSLWEPGFDDVIKALYTYTDNGGNVSRYIARTYVEYNGDYTIECLSPDQKLGPNEEAEAIFAVYEVSPSGKKPYTGASIEFSAPEGFITTQSTVTDAFGMARVTFHNDGDDAKEYPVTARFWVRNDNGGLYTGTATAKFITLNYQLEALTPKLAVRNDGSEQDCFFTLYEYHNGKWNVSEKKVEAKFEATGVTLTKTSDMNRGYGFITNFTVGKSFNQGSITAKCDIQLESGKVWQGVATTELVADDYLFTRISPDGGNPAYVYAEESEEVAFLLTKLVNGQYQFCPGMEVKFECQEGGTLSSTLVKTDANGLATTSFQLNKDEENATVYVNCSFADEHGIWHVYEEDVEFELTPYKLEAATPKLAVKNDGSEQSCYFNLFEYKNGKWEEYKEEVEVDFKADGVTLSETSYMYKGYGARAPFTAGKSFKEGSVTAECDIELDNGHIWHGVATTELVLDNYQFSRVLPEDSPAGIYPDESQDVVFSLTKLVNGTYQPCQGEEVIFSSPEGTLTSMLELTDAEGKAATSFQLKKDRPNPFVSARCRFTDELGIRHEYSEIVDFFMTPYKLEAVTPKLAVRNDGSDQRCEFALYEYKDDKWEKCKKEVEVKFEAIGVTLSETSYMNRGYGVEAHFTAGKSFKEGSITAKCDIEIANGKVWHGVATTELVLDNYQFSRVLPKDNPAGIYPDESQDVVFQLSKLVNGTYQPCQGKEVIFSSPEGTFTSMLEVTDAEGKAATSFEIKKDMRNAFAHATCRFTDEQGVYHFYSENVDFILIPYRLKCLTPEVEMKKSDGTATIRYELLEYKEGEWVACHDKKLLFTATNGSAQPDYALTNENGICQTVFTPTEGATEGTVTGTCTIVVNEKANFVWTQSQTAHITISEGGGEEPCVVDDPDLQKANPLDNGYVVKNTKTGETMTRSYNPDYSEWTKTPDVIKFQLNDEEVDAQGYPNTKGMLYGFIPLTMRGVVLSLTGQQFENTPGAKVGFGVYDGLYVSTDFMCTSGEGGSMTTEGEIKPDGKSKIMVRKPCNQKVINKSRALGDEQEEDYTDEYELLYYLVFTTQAYNPETQQSEEVELEVYGKGTMKMHVPSITGFVAGTEKDWVKVGESTKVTLEAYQEEGATWDWNDVKIIGQSTDYTKARNGTDEGFFSWDASTQTLTSLKSNDNKRVNVCLGLISNPEVKYTLMINTGEGWKYTMIKTSEEEMTQKANSYFQFSFDWSPKESESEKMDFNALELDPETNPNGYFTFPYRDTRWPVFVSSKCPAGEYILRFRVKSNHDVNCTMKFIITAKEEDQ